MTTETITIQGKEFTIPAPYTEGHTLTAGEASALNQVFGENLRNNFAKKVKDAVEAGSFDQTAMQESLDKYASEYQFGVRTGGGGARVPRDPVAAEALRIAVDAIHNKLKADGKNPRDYDAKSIREAAAQVVAGDPSYTEQAKEIVAARQEAAQASLGDVLSGLTVKAKKADGNAPATDETAAQPEAAPTSAAA